MCGIAGIINREEFVPKENVQTMCNLIKHRGPDDEGIFVSQNIGIGMRRLSIIDLNTGHQPIWNEEENVVIVFNGEIYNYQELKRTLIGLGHKFRTQTDTETILHAYEEYGSDCLKYINGMFAFVIVDLKQQQVFSARDRMGIKPFYYYLNKDKFIFASEIKSIVPFLPNKEINHDALSDYLTFRYVTQDKCIWTNVNKLKPGSFMTINLTNWHSEIKTYWSLPVPGVSIFEGRSENDLHDEFAYLFEDAVKQHLIADVPTGVFLSGGLDSTAVMAACKKIHSGTIKSFNVGYLSDSKFDESIYARLASKDLGTEHFEIKIGVEDFKNFLPKLAYYSDEPLADLASIPLYYVSSLAAKHVKVVLSGEGSDEILGGYTMENVYRKVNLISKYQKIPEIIRISIANIISKMSSKYGDLANLANLNIYDIPLNAINQTEHYFSILDKQNYLINKPSFEDSLNLVKNHFKAAGNQHPVNQLLYSLSQDWLVEDLLMKADKMTMANSIELRVPFLDYRLVEMAAKWPINMKTGVLNGKLVSKMALRKYSSGKIPEKIINRPKQGFPVPAYAWLEKDLKPFTFDLLGDGAKCFSYFNKKEVSNLIRLATSPQSSRQTKQKLWNILIFELWLQNWV